MDLEVARDRRQHRLAGGARGQAPRDHGRAPIVSHRSRAALASHASTDAERREKLIMDWCKKIGQWIRDNIEQPIEQFFRDAYQSCTEARKWVEHEIRTPIETWR